MFFRPAQHQQEQDASRTRSSEDDVANESEADEEAEELDIPLDAFQPFSHRNRMM